MLNHEEEDHTQRPYFRPSVRRNKRKKEHGRHQADKRLDLSADKYDYLIVFKKPSKPRVAQRDEETGCYTIPNEKVHLSLDTLPRFETKKVLNRIFLVRRRRKASRKGSDLVQRSKRRRATGCTGDKHQDKRGSPLKFGTMRALMTETKEFQTSVRHGKMQHGRNR